MIKIFSKKVDKATQPVSGYGGWWPWWIKEPFTGAWQRNIEWKRKDVLSYYAVFACTTLIAGDIGKLRVKMVKESANIWEEIKITSKYQVLKKPNGYQNIKQFKESWILSKLNRGNAYIYKERNGRGDIIALHVLHPDLVLPLVTDEGDVYYQLGQDNLAGVTPESFTVPASEIIHDRFNCFFHPLVGLSPLFASGLPAFLGLKMSENGAKHFQNGSRPAGILTVPEAISPARAKELSEQWEENYGGENQGKTAIIGGDLKYQPISMTAVESQMVEQQSLNGVMVCATYHVPPYKIGIGNIPSYNNVQALNLEYYNSALQTLIEAMEICLDEGLDVQEDEGIELDLDGLLRMDSKSQIETFGMGVDKGVFAPNEARNRMNIRSAEGGDKPFMQHQMWPINVLANRTLEDLNPTPVQQESSPTPITQDDEKSLMSLSILLRKELSNA